MTSRILSILPFLLLAACDKGTSPKPATIASAATPSPGGPIAHPAGSGDPVIPLPPPDPLRETISFAFGQSRLDAPAKAKLDALLKAEPVRAGGTLAIRGSTDSHGDNDLNRAISLGRARLVASYLAAKGVGRERITVVGLGAGRPVAPNVRLDGSDDPAGRARNRRVDIEVTAPPVPDHAPVAGKPA